MLQRDYFIRIIQEFMAALAAFLEKEKDTPDKGLKELYRQYVGDYDTLRNLTTDELLGYAKEQWKGDCSEGELIPLLVLKISPM